ncbi:hypothetical protein B0H13DRAFT_2074005, partial [Mycena leptocephala]
MATKSTTSALRSTMKHLPLYVFLAPFLAVRAANVTTTPPEYDPTSTVCPGNCLGTYTNAKFAEGTCLWVMFSCFTAV